MKRMGRIFSFVLALALALTNVSVNIYAEEIENIAVEEHRDINLSEVLEDESLILNQEIGSEETLS